MRVFLINWGSKEQELSGVAKDLEKNSHEVVYWVRSNRHFKVDKSEFPNTIFHDYHDALNGLPAEDKNLSDFPPIGEELLKKLSNLESLTMDMMERDFFDKTLQEKKYLYFDYVRYWYGVLQKYKPDVIIFPFLPHRCFDFVIYYLAKFLGIKTMLFELPAMDISRLMVMEDFQEGSPKLKEFLNNNERDRTLDDLSQEFQDYYKKQVDGASDVTPLSTVIRRRKHTGSKVIFRKIKNALKSIFDLSFFSKTFYNLKKAFLVMFKNTPRKEYAKFQVNVDFGKKYIYIPLHYQPERTTSPAGGIFTNQILMIEMLSFVLPKDWLIYVKEHPSQWLAGRSVEFSPYRPEGYYEKIAKIPNVYLAPVNTSSIKMVKNAQVVASVQGTASWEAVLRSKPAIISGHPWYQNCQGVHIVKDTKTAQEVMDKILLSNAAATKTDIINFLWALDSSTSNCYLNPSGRMVSELAPKQNRSNVTNALLEELKNIKL